MLAAILVRVDKHSPGDLENSAVFKIVVEGTGVSCRNYPRAHNSVSVNETGRRQSLLPTKGVE